MSTSKKSEKIPKNSDRIPKEFTKKIPNQNPPTIHPKIFPKKFVNNSLKIAYKLPKNI